MPLLPKAFDTFLILLRNNGRLVLKEDLLKAVWPDSVVKEGSLTQNISVLRKAPEKAGEERKYIETVAKRGYRLITEVCEVMGDENAPPARKDRALSSL